MADSCKLMQELQERGLILQVTDERGLSKRLASGPISLYCGFDPTADSLHLGHLVPLMCLKRFQLAGHLPVALIGGATGLIGDPSFKATERKLHAPETVRVWVEKIKHQISLLIDFDCRDNSLLVVNNHDWFSAMNMLTFLRDIGKHFSINQLIHKELIKQRLNRADNGVSFTEFSYNLLQSYDFAFLNKQYGVELQIGGSDQWGNIISGVELTRRLHHHTVYGLTVPIITKADGTKFGKTEGNTVWLDSRKTSPYNFYQFWVNTADSDVYRFLKLFTFLSLSTIEALEQEDQTRVSGKPPRAQYILAEEMTRMVHGVQGLSAAKRITASLFTNVLTSLDEDDFAQLAQDGMPMVVLGCDVNNLQQALVAAKLVSSRRQARVMIRSNAVAVNGKKKAEPEYIFHEADKLYNHYTLLQRGKKHYCLLYWQ
ncbi:tyrosine--tRNA ligase [Sodalis endosymbiont of Henestaris halophilus]|uniref:tyrosine--tRNA ligase n=1 Tax=Sodalis endosymbiont of Henestaris halophilus TaxID=1929246 RepID=UPI000BBF430F|nr:tyrosine--tRNA ligase [Sodalis endosymbiont of Henestaris halophilus]SNC58782.1 Tyrosine--tRNA ligase [Sodalis endosymbiont of Henestaris halophilus]